ncbi:MAG: DEAD/DEAH box helicase [Actinobacteria bacterium]|nr:DEAD/DEAH box helicase [Actinomycetota bacterium]
MSASSSSPKSPRARKLQKDRAVGKAGKSKASTAKGGAKKSSATNGKKTKAKTVNTKPARFTREDEILAKSGRTRRDEATEKPRRSRDEAPTGGRRVRSDDAPATRRPARSDDSAPRARPARSDEAPTKSRTSRFAEDSRPERKPRTKRTFNDSVDFRDEDRPSRGRSEAPARKKPAGSYDSDSRSEPRKRSSAPRSAPRRDSGSSYDRRPPRTNSRPPAAGKAMKRQAQPAPSGTETFESVGVHPALVKLLAKDGITEPFSIQQATLPDAIAGLDVLGRAQTGSGKTLAFGLAMLTKLAGRKAKPRQPLGLVLVPTRELAMQVTDALTPLARVIDLDVRLIAGGMPYAKQIDALRRGVPILVSTPGRLSDLVDQGHCDLSQIQVVVLDEADQMCDMGFMPQMIDILDLVPTEGQRLLFSATLDGDVDRLVSRYLKDPVLHETSATGASVTTMEHHVLIVEPREKDEVLQHIAARNGKSILFVRTQAAADRISSELAYVGIPVGALHGGKSQNLRTRTINEFREGVTDVLVATDVAARGIHVDGISLVVHVDPPGDPKDYLHRSGRTARAGDEGRVVTIIGPRQQRTVLGMMDRIGVEPEVTRVTADSRALAEITGAQEPSGKPWKLPKSAPTGGGRGRPSGGGRRNAGGGRSSGRPRNR